MMNQAFLKVGAVAIVAYVASTLLGCGQVTSFLNDLKDQLTNATDCVNTTLQELNSNKSLEKHDPDALPTLAKLCPGLNMAKGMDMLKDHASGNAQNLTAVCNGAEAAAHAKCIFKGIISTALPEFRKCCEPLTDRLQKPCESMVDKTLDISDDLDECRKKYPGSIPNKTTPDTAVEETVMNVQIPCSSGNCYSGGPPGWLGGCSNGVCTGSDGLANDCLCVCIQPGAPQSCPAAAIVNNMSPEETTPDTAVEETVMNVKIYGSSVRFAFCIGAFAGAVIMFTFATLVFRRQGHISVDLQAPLTA